MHKCLFILDTNILMHDPTAIFRFPGHDVYLAMVILEELDAAKKGMSEVARNVRQVSRFLDELIHNQTQIEHGIDLSTLPAQMATDNIEGLTLSIQTNGRLFFQTQAFPKNFLPDTLPGLNPDNSLLNTAIAIQRSDSTRQVILVSKDINLRIKAHVLGIHAEDYINDKVLDDVDLLYTGVKNLDTEFCTLHWEALRTWQGQGYYTITADFVPHLFVNQCLIGDNGFEAIVKTCAGQQAGLELARDFRSAKNNIWGINARNSEQNFALNVLMDPEIDFISLLGPAGTGKTLLALAAGLAQTLDQQRYREIIVTRVTVALGEDIGFLPGTEEEK
ncbi:MAG: PIN domain-containing protein, partial [Pseudomonadota bacterium]|nr:PIN domain-containing protein [Pseudomonadota bacterium]